MNLHERAAAIIASLRKSALPDPGDEREVMHTPLLRSSAALIAAMDARIRELEADAERLDWLENNEAVVSSHREEIDEGEYAIFWQVADRLRKKSLSGHPLGSPRDALDAARKEQTT